MRAVRPEYREVVEWVRDRLQIARAFLTSEPTIAQRIVRAKRRLAGKQVPFEVPRGADRAAASASATAHAAAIGCAKGRFPGYDSEPGATGLRAVDGPADLALPVRRHERPTWNCLAGSEVTNCSSPGP